ncbi:MAG: hypothetical protein HZA64_00720 [Rhodocyclales bacterium]|nr:hypothetical protein [Rhodocyclales bacterium]
MNQRRCWLHIGAPKTGTTAIQRFLEANQDLLPALGFAYPIAARRAGGHHDLAFLAGGGYPDWAVPQDQTLDALVAALRAEIEAGPATTILSSENFYLLCEPAAVLDLMVRLGFPRGAVTVVVYLRRQDEAALSWYNQAVKAQGYAGSFEEHLTTHHDLWDYDARLRAWAEAFGADCLAVRSYDGDVRRDFVEAVGLPADDLHFAAERVNTEINSDILEFQRQLNRLPLPPQQKRAFHKQLIALTAASAGSGLFTDAPLLDDAGRQRLLESYASGNRRVADAYFGGGELFAPLLTGSNIHLPPAPGLTPEKLAALVGWLLLGQCDQGKKGPTP